MKENDEKYKILCGNETYFIRKRKEGRKKKQDPCAFENCMSDVLCIRALLMRATPAGISHVRTYFIFRSSPFPSLSRSLLHVQDNSSCFQGSTARNKETNRIGKCEWRRRLKKNAEKKITKKKTNYWCFLPGMKEKQYGDFLFLVATVDAGKGKEKWVCINQSSGDGVARIYRLAAVIW